MSLEFEHQCYEYASALERLAVPSDKDLFLRALAMQLVLAGKGPDQAARLARATWAELYPQPAPTKTPPMDKPLCDRDTTPLSMQGCRLPVGDGRVQAQAADCDDLYHAAKAGK